MWKPSLRTKSWLPWLAAVAVPWVGGAGILCGVIYLGKLAKEHLAGKDTVEVAAIDCEPPTGMTRKDFLEQVQYYAEPQLPDRLTATDSLIKKVFEAFCRHPWVEKVEGITRLPDGRLRVKLVYRSPVLAVEVGSQRRVVDGHGILLPSDAAAEGLPLLRQGKILKAGREGTLLGDDRVKAAARTAAFLCQEQSKLAVTEITDTSDGLVLTTATGTRIIWGRPLLDQADADSTAERKREKLRTQELHAGQVDLRGEDEKR